MATPTSLPKIAVIVGSNRRESINRRLAQALVKLGGGRFEANFVRIDDLPMFNPDLEASLPGEVLRYKDEVSAADGLLIVSEYHPFRRVWSHSANGLEVGFNYFNRGPYRFEVGPDVLYPGPEKTQLLKGPPGTEMILVIVGPDVPAGEGMQRFWDSDSRREPMPKLPPGTLVRVSPAGVVFEGERSRDLGQIRDRSDPEEKIRDRLEELRKKLESRSSFFEGVAFARE